MTTLDPDLRSTVDRRTFITLVGGVAVTASCSGDDTGETSGDTTTSSTSSSAAPPSTTPSSTTTAAQDRPTPRLFADDDTEAIAPPAPGSVERVIVVGAGVAGLTAAKALYLSGIDVVVVEGRDRIGGRTHTVELAGASVDLGASWVHAGPGSSIAPMLDKIGTDQLPASTTDQVLNAAVFDRRDGVYPDADMASRLLGVLAGLELSDPAVIAAGPEGESLEAAFGRILDPAVVSGDDGPGAFNAATGLLGTLDGEELGDMSADIYANEYLGPTEFDDDHFPEGGYVTLVDALAEGLDIRLGAVVSHVIDRGDGAAVVVEGEEMIGSHVVVTVPLGVLKDHTIEFEPPLSDAKELAIERIGFGAFEKVALAYDEAFWQVDGPTDILVADPDSRAWPLILDLSTFYGTPVVIGLTGGDHARALAALPVEDRVAEFATLMAEIGGPSAPEPTGSSTSDWTNSPFTRGCYSGLAASDATSADQQALGSPAGRVLFAGEATSVDKYGYVDGAWQSGIREAKRLLQTAEVPVL